MRRSMQAIFAASRTVLESAAFRSDQAAQESVMTLAVRVSIVIVADVIKVVSLWGLTWIGLCEPTTFRPALLDPFRPFDAHSTHIL